MRKLLLSTTILLLLPANFSFLYQPVNYREILFSLTNSLNVDIISSVVTDVDPFDWVDPRGPLLDFQDLQIPSKVTLNITTKCNLDVTWLPFTMTHAFADGTRAKFRYYLSLVAPYNGFRHVLDGNRDVSVKIRNQTYNLLTVTLTVN